MARMFHEMRDHHQEGGVRDRHLGNNNVIKQWQCVCYWLSHVPQSLKEETKSNGDLSSVLQHNSSSVSPCLQFAQKSVLCLWRYRLAFI